jgi:hypothetical protein
MSLPSSTIQAGALDRDGAKHRPDVGGMRAFTALPVTAVCTGTLCLQVRRHLLLHHDLLQRLEDGFAFGEGQAQRGGGEAVENRGHNGHRLQRDMVAIDQLHIGPCPAAIAVSEGWSPAGACGRGSGTKMPFALLIHPLYYLST